MNQTWLDQRSGAVAAHAPTVQSDRNRTLPRGGGSGPRACRTCALAKVRCIPNGGDDSRCQRCARLQKDCALQHTKERKKRNTVSRKTRVSQLEKKLDDIVTLLKASNDEAQDQNYNNISTETNTSTDNTGPIPAAPLSNSNLDAIFHRRTSSAIYSDAVPKSFAAPRTALQESTNENDLTQTSAIQGSRTESQFGFSPMTQQDACLEIYRTSMHSYFPFVLIPDNISAKELSEKKPFLAQTIFAVAHYKESGPQAERGKKLLQDLSNRLLFEGEKSLDLLQGLLVYISWYRSFFYSGRIMTTLVQMATSLVVDLGLNCPVQQDRYKTVQEVVWTLLLGVVSIPQQTLEEKRAFLGCFYISSWTAFSTLGMDPMPYTPYVQECCQALTEAAEYPSDLLVVEMIRIQGVMNCVRQAIPSRQMDIEKSHTLVRFHVSAAEQQLQSLRKNWPQDKAVQDLLPIHYHYAEMLLYEIPVFLILNRPNFNPSNWPPDLNHLVLEYLSKLASAASGVLDTFFSIQPKGYFHITTMLWKPFGRATIVIRKLSFLKEVPGWDYKKAREQSDLPGILDKIISNAIQASEISWQTYATAGVATTDACVEGYKNNSNNSNNDNLQNKNDMLLELAARMRRLKAGYIEAVRLDETGVPIENLASALVLPRTAAESSLQQNKQQPQDQHEPQPHQQRHHQQQQQHDVSSMSVGGLQQQQQAPQQHIQGTDMWTTEVGETLLAMDEDFWLGFWQEWQIG